MLPRVLIVDDDASVREILAEFFAIRDYQVVTAASPHEALAACEQSRVDVVVLDLALGEADGFAVLETMRTAYPQTPIVAITGMRPFDEWRTEALQRGAAGFVTKEESTERLLLEVRRVLRLAAEKRRDQSPGRT